MCDYEKLVKALRQCGTGDFPSCATCGVDNVTCGEIKRLRMRRAADAIEELKQNIEQYKLYLQDAINDLRSAHEKEPKWTSVDERLPEDKETCLIWYEYYHYSLERVLPEYGIGFYLSMYDMWYGDPSTGKDVKVLYWMPLPQPPKEDDNA